MGKIINLLIFLLVAFNLFWIDCRRPGRFKSSRVGPTSKVVLAALNAANKGEYLRANSYCILNFSQEGEFGTIMSFEGWHNLTKNGSIKKNEVLEEKVFGEKATVLIKINYKDVNINEPKKCKISLVKKKKYWIIFDLSELSREEQSV